MAFFPCSNHHAPYRGPSSAAYAAIVNNVTQERGKLRMCPVCFVEYMQSAGSSLVEVVDEESATRSLGCYKCGANSDAAQLDSIFVTTYPRNAEPRNLYGRVCANHRADAVAQFLLK